MNGGGVAPPVDAVVDDVPQARGPAARTRRISADDHRLAQAADLQRGVQPRRIARGDPDALVREAPEACELDLYCVETRKETGDRIAAVGGRHRRAREGRSCRDSGDGRA